MKGSRLRVGAQWARGAGEDAGKLRATNMLAATSAYAAAALRPSEVHELGGEGGGPLGEEPARQDVGAARTLDDPAGVASVAVQLEPFAAIIGWTEQPQVSHGFGPSEDSVYSEVVWESTRRVNRLSGCQIDEPHALPAAIARLVAQPGVETVQRRVQQIADDQRLAVVRRGRIAAVDLVFALQGA